MSIETVHVTIETWQFLNYREVAPLADAINDKFMFTDMKRYNREPTMAGGVDAALTLTFLQTFGGGSGILQQVLKDYTIAVLVELAMDATGIRTAIAQLMAKARERTALITTRRYIPCVLNIGHMPFHFDEPITADEFSRRCIKAKDFIDTLPLSDIGNPGGQDYAFRWDTEADNWKGPWPYPRRVSQ